MRRLLWVVLLAACAPQYDPVPTQFRKARQACDLKGAAWRYALLDQRDFNNPQNWYCIHVDSIIIHDTLIKAR